MTTYDCRIAQEFGAGERTDERNLAVGAIGWLAFEVGVPTAPTSANTLSSLTISLVAATVFSG